jgi:hypothetical protein
VDTRIFSAHNEASKRTLSAGLVVVDAAREPLKVLKVLMEGLPKSAPEGLWFINFKGVPVARSQSPFDLVYLDEHARVVQAIEISPTSIFESFSGSPASAFILPPKSVSRSKTFTGDRIAVKVVGNLPAPAPPRVPAKSTVARTPTREIPAPASRSFTAPLSGAQPHASGSLLRSASAVIAPPAAVAQAAAGASEAPGTVAPTVPQPEPQAAVPQLQPAQLEAVPPAAQAPALQAASAEPPESVQAAPPTAAPEHEPEPIPTPDTQPAASFSTAAVAAEPGSAGPVTEVEAPAESPAQPPVEAAPAVIAPLPAESREPYVVLVDPPLDEEIENAPSVTEESLVEFAPEEPVVAPDVELPFAFVEPARASASPLAELLVQQPSAALAKPLPPILRNTWDVRLLYSFFPKLRPSYRPEFHAPRVGVFSLAKPHEEINPHSLKMRMLCWLYPDLQLDTVHLRQREARRAPRVANPGLVGYFFTGGLSKPNEIRSLSVTGFFMKTEERWLPGTVIRITLQMLSGTADEPGETVTVHSRVVNWNDEGGGFEFVLPGFVAD